jgi:hypothetical protein
MVSVCLRATGVLLGKLGGLGEHVSRPLTSLLHSLPHRLDVIVHVAHLVTRPGGLGQEPRLLWDVFATTVSRVAAPPAPNLDGGARPG